MTDIYLYTTPLDPRAKPLLEDIFQDYHARYGGGFFGPDDAAVEKTSNPPEAFAPPRGNFLLLLRDGETIGGGAFKRHDESTAEFKRIWTRSDLRRQGLARALVAELEAQALRQGYRRIFLMTGCRQPEAAGLYLTCGYRALFDPGADWESLRILSFEKDLAPPAESPARSEKLSLGSPD